MIELTARELKEIELALLYARDFAHGTTGHNALIIISKLAQHVGFVRDDGSVCVPGNVVVKKEAV